MTASGGGDGATPGPTLVRVLPAGTMQGIEPGPYLAAASAAGFDAVSFRPSPVREWVAGAPERSVEALAALVGDHGLVVAELDPVTGWHRPAAHGSLPAEVTADLDLAAALGARAVTALVLPGERWDAAGARDGLAALADAAESRSLLVQVEPFAWSPLWDLAEAAALIRECARGNLGLMVDTWHVSRRGGSASLGDVEPGIVLGVQLADGPAIATSPDLAVENRTHRAFPGDPDGGLRPDHLLRSLSDRGWRGPVGVEVFGDPGPDPFARARRARRALDLVLHRADLVDGTAA